MEPVVGNFQPNQPAIFETHTEPLTIAGWPETPWQLIKPGLDAEYLGIPDLNSRLQANERIGDFADPAPYRTQWHYRWALPLGCSGHACCWPRRWASTFRGVARAAECSSQCILSGLMLLLTSISVALGESGRLCPAHAAWLPNFDFCASRVYLFHRRISGQPIYLALRRCFLAAATNYSYPMAIAEPGMSAPAGASAPPPNAASSMAKSS